MINIKLRALEKVLRGIFGSTEDKEKEDEKDFMVSSFLFCVLHIRVAIWTGMSFILIVFTN
jgi:hypothetical protein